MKCELCKQEVTSLGKHLSKKHQYNNEQYFLEFIGTKKQCVNCGKETPWQDITRGYSDYCCRKCSGEYVAKQHVLNGFNPSRLDYVKEKKKETLKKNYGEDVNSPMQIKEIRDKQKETVMERYGVENISQVKEIQDKKIQTNLERYGTEQFLASDYAKQKSRSTNLEKYGCWYTQTLEYKEKRKEYYDSDEYKQETFIRYLENRFPLFLKQLDKLNLKFLSNIEKDYISYGTENLEFQCTICDTKFTSSITKIKQVDVYSTGRCPKCKPKMESTSYQELEVLDFIRSLGIEANKDNDIIAPKEIDIYIPYKKIGVEYCGLYWHSELNPAYGVYDHRFKMELCKKKEIRLITIFEDEWLYKKEIVKDRIKNILGIKNDRVIYARNCEIKEIEPDIKNRFLEDNHIQGKDSSTIKLGAFFDNELISVMTFSLPNLVKGQKEQIKGKWELNRFCSKIGIHIPGIASKFLSYFKKNYDWFEIYSYADMRWSKGNLYYQLGFNLESTTNPGYSYTDGIVRIHRFNLRAQNGVPEKIISEQLGLYRIFDCGHLKFSMSK